MIANRPVFAPDRAATAERENDPLTVKEPKKLPATLAHEFLVRIDPLLGVRRDRLGNGGGLHETDERHHQGCRQQRQYEVRAQRGNRHGRQAPRNFPDHRAPRGKGDRVTADAGEAPLVTVTHGARGELRRRVEGE